MRKFARPLSLFAVLMLPAGCEEQPKTSKPRIALIMKGLNNEFFLTMENGARDHASKNASQYDLLTSGIKDDASVNDQVGLVEQAIAQRVDAVVIAPADSKSLVSVCKKAQDAGITVVNIDNKLDAEVLAGKGVKFPFVGPDNRKGARLAGEVLAKKLKAGDAVVIVEGVPSAFNAVQRRLGFEDAMKAGGMNIVDTQSAHWLQDEAQKVVSNLIIKHPELKGICCANDNMALGAVRALEAAKKGDSILVAGFDNIRDVQKLIREGKILATVDQHADRQAVEGIEYALGILKTKTAPADMEMPVDLITRETLK